MKTCPYCAEEIQDAAIKCRFCGEWLEQEEAPVGIHGYDVLLVSLGPHLKDAVTALKIVLGDSAGVEWRGLRSSDLPITILHGVSAEEAVKARSTLNGVGHGAQVEVRDTITGTLVDSNERKHVPRCPTCTSDRVERIGAGRKLGAAAAVGVFAIGKMAQTYHCPNCGARW